MAFLPLALVYSSTDGTPNLLLTTTTRKFTTTEKKQENLVFDTSHHPHASSDFHLEKQNSHEQFRKKNLFRNILFPEN